MTKHQFDAATQQNWGGPFMASDEREQYKADRCKGTQRAGRLERRAAYNQPYKWHNIRKHAVTSGNSIFVD